jgi:hypothetical protein
VKVAHTLALFGVNLAVAACVAGPPPGPTGMVAPGKDKSQAAFQQDQSICQQHAVAQTGYGNAPQSSRPSSSGRNAPRLNRRPGQRPDTTGHRTSGRAELFAVHGGARRYCAGDVRGRLQRWV